MADLIAALPQDALFLYELFATAKLEEMAAWNWPPGEEQEFLRMQYEAQQQSYCARYPDASSQIILCDGYKAGRVLTACVDADIVVIDLVLLPAFRNRGIGTAVLRDLQQAAQAQQLNLCLHVLMTSPARRLYARLGFREDGFSLPFMRMRWQPGPPPGRHPAPG